MVSPQSLCACVSVCRVEAVRSRTDSTPFSRFCRAFSPTHSPTDPHILALELQLPPYFPPSLKDQLASARKDSQSANKDSKEQQ